MLNVHVHAHISHKNRNVGQCPTWWSPCWTQVAPSCQRCRVWLTLTTWLPCSNAAKTRNLLKLAGVPHNTGSISAVSGRCSSYCGDILRTYCCFTSFFSDCRYVPWLRRYSPTKLCDGTQIAIFGDCFGSCIFSEPSAAHFRHAF